MYTLGWICWYSRINDAPMIRQFKGTVSRDEYFLRVPKIKLVLLAQVLMVFTIFGSLIWRKKKKFQLASIKSLTNSINPSTNPVQEACSGFQVPMMLKGVPKAICYSKNYSQSWLCMYSGENWPVPAKTEILLTVCRISELKKQKLFNYFYLSQGSLKFQNHLQEVLI